MAKSRPWGRCVAARELAARYPGWQMAKSRPCGRCVAARELAARYPGWQRAKSRPWRRCVAARGLAAGYPGWQLAKSRRADDGLRLGSWPRATPVGRWPSRGRGDDGVAARELA